MFTDPVASCFPIVSGGSCYDPDPTAPDDPCELLCPPCNRPVLPRKLLYRCHVIRGRLQVGRIETELGNMLTKGPHISEWLATPLL